MGGLKNFVLLWLVQVVCSYPHQRYVRNAALQQPSYGSPYGYPYQPSFGYPTLGSSQMYPQQSHPYYPSYPSYGSSYPGYGSVYPSYGSYPSDSMYPYYGYPSYGSSYPGSYPSYGSSYPSYGASYPSSYPSYPSYPSQPNYPAQPDPFAHIPTEIIDVDENGNFDFGFLQPNVNISSSHNATVSRPNNQAHPFYTHTKIVESKPVSATITRVIGQSSSKPTVDVTYSDPNSQKGSGVLVEAAENGNEETAAKSGTDGEGGGGTNAQVSEVDEAKQDNEKGGKKKDEKEAGKGFSFFG